MRFISSLALLCSIFLSAALQAQTTVNIPGVIQAENYVAFLDNTAGNTGGKFRNDNVDIGVAKDTGDGFSVGWIDAGEWLEYNINVTQAGNYEMTARVASQPGNGAFTVKMGSLATATGPFNVAATGGWDTYTTTAPIAVGALAVGTQTVRMQATKAGFNLNWIELKLVPGGSSSSANSSTSGTSTAVPGVVQAESYANFNDTTTGNAGGQLRSDNVDIEVTTDTGGGHNIGWTDTGEWLELPINVTQAGSYTANVRVASLNGGGMFTLELGGQTRGNTFSVAATGGWQTWTTLSTNLGDLNAGVQTLRIQMQAGGFNINWVELKLATASSSSTASSASSSAPNVMVGKFNVSKDLLLAQFDTKPDVDDIHAQAGVGTLLKNYRLAGVKYFAVQGTFGNQGGTFIDSSSVMNIAFPGNWVSAANNVSGALNQVLDKVKPTLTAGGHVWIVEAGQSNFTAAMVRRLQTELPAIDTRIFIHVVQHSDFNESQTSSGDLSLVKGATQYNKIPDGNSTGNGSPGFNTGDGSNWNRATSNANVGSLWTAARSLANSKNVSPNAYINQNIKNGGFDFSDTVEATWIFGFNDLFDTNAFFNMFL
jgi:hypothetical protein